MSTRPHRALDRGRKPLLQYALEAESTTASAVSLADRYRFDLALNRFSARSARRRPSPARLYPTRQPSAAWQTTSR